MRLALLLGRILFIFGGLLLIAVGLCALNSPAGIFLPMAGLCFMVRGAWCFSTLLNTDH